jgi:hypothetical protein
MEQFYNCDLRVTAFENLCVKPASMNSQFLNVLMEICRTAARASFCERNFRNNAVLRDTL